MKTETKVGLVFLAMLVSGWCGFFMAYVMEFTQNYLRFG